VIKISIRQNKVLYQEGIHWSLMVREKLEYLRDRYSGERIFVLGNGPSLSETPLEKLDEEHTLAMNKISRIYPDTSWRPSFYFLSTSPENPNMPEDYQSENFISKNVHSETLCLLASDYESYFGNDKNIYYFDRFKLLSHNPFHRANLQQINEMPIKQIKKFWSNEIAHHIYTYHTMYGAIQAAAYMGFEKIYFLGCDLGMEYLNPHMLFKSGLDPYHYDNGIYSYIKDSLSSGKLAQSIINAVAMKIILHMGDSQIIERIFSGSGSRYHFTSEYFDELTIYDPTGYEKDIIKSHMAAKRICEELGIELYNATLGGELEVYERVHLNNLL
jgi:hypothetical protein